MTLHLYDTLTAQKRPFTPIHEGKKVGIYVCGMTVYDYCHIGHARVMVVFDVIVRWLKHLDYEVNYVRNITDIDDKIIKRANENGESIRDLTERFIAFMHQDADALGCVRPNSEPRATEHIPQMLSMITTLQNKDLAYQGQGGDVYYAVDKFPSYGKLSKRKLADMQAGASERVGESDDKHNPFDFVLWKSAKPSEPHWDSPWGVGRPGWHIECSAMSTCCLGETFDIHGGGHDLQFPHHENEIAQSEGATGKTYANNWLHVGFVNVDGEKMSKSLNNFFTIREVMADFHAETIRFFILSSHYRSPINFSDTTLRQAEKTLLKLYSFRKDCLSFEGQFWWEIDRCKEKIKKTKNYHDDHYRDFYNAMNNDFNTVEAIACIMNIVKEIEFIKRLIRDQNEIMRGKIHQISDESISNYLLLIETFNQMTRVLNICSINKSNQIKGRIKNFFSILEKIRESNPQYLSDDKILAKIDARNQAKADKNYALADQIRAELKEQGIELEDSRAGTTWRRI